MVTAKAVVIEEAPYEPRVAHTQLYSVTVIDEVQGLSVIASTIFVVGLLNGTIDEEEDT